MMPIRASLYILRRFQYRPKFVTYLLGFLGLSIEANGNDFVYSDTLIAVKDTLP
jgi:hypothetical protein